MEKTDRTMQHLSSLTGDFGLNSENCGKPVKGFFMYVRNYSRIIRRKIRKEARAETREVFPHVEVSCYGFRERSLWVGLQQY